MRTQILAAASGLLLLSGAALAADPDATAPARPAAKMAPAASERTSAEQLIGKSVIGANNEDIGKVKDVILEPQSGKAKQLVVASGGFLGIGEKLVAVDYNDAELNATTSKVMIPGLSRQQVQAMREFNYDDNMVALSRTTDMDRRSIDDSSHNRAKP